MVYLIHISDIHFTRDTNLENRFESLADRVKRETKEGDKLVLVITGDIAQSGNIEEYAVAKKHIEIIQNKVDSELELVMVPGNHDCNFENQKAVRKALIKEPNYDDLGCDSSVSDICLTVQNEFYEFYNMFDKDYKNNMYYIKKYEEASIKISFICLNTSWMSSREEKPGTMFYPIKSYQDEIKKLTKDSITIALMHHTTNWFNPSIQKKINNKLEVENFLNENIAVQIAGHEHQGDGISITNHNTNETSHELRRLMFNDNKTEQSQFNLIKIIKNNSIKYKVFEYKNDDYIEVNGWKDLILKKRNREAVLKKEYLDSMLHIDIPIGNLKFGSTIMDMFVFPEFDRKSMSIKDINGVINSDKVIYDDNQKVIFVEGENQSGKTTLVRYLAKDFYDKGEFPLLVDGSVLNLISYSEEFIYQYKVQYKFVSIKAEDLYNNSKFKKVLLIDNFELIRNIGSETNLNEVFSQFDKVIITMDKVVNVSPKLMSKISDYNKYDLLPLGQYKMNELIKKYIANSDSYSMMSPEDVFSKVKESFDKVKRFLGEQILPPYPFFVISLLEMLENASYKIQGTSYGNCYNALLITSLIKKAGVSNDDQSINVYINFVQSLAFEVFRNNEKSISNDDLREFYLRYKNLYKTEDLDLLKEVLLNANIIKKRENEFSFSYKYIFFFLVAKYIAGLKTNDGNKIIDKLFEDMHKEDNASILVFITYHRNDIDFIEESVLRVMSIYEKHEEITLDKGCKLAEEIGDLSKIISDKIIEHEINPVKNREEILKKVDEKRAIVEKNNKKITGMEDNINPEIVPFLKAYRAIDIMGQIMKNRSRSVQTDDLVYYYQEIYKTCLRSISTLTDMLSESKGVIIHDLTESINADNDKKHPEKNMRKIELSVRKKVTGFMQMMNLFACLSMFEKMVEALGMKGFAEEFEKVAENIGSPAAKIISYSINSYYNGTTPREVKKIAKELEDYPVAFSILQSRVKSHLTTNYVDYKDRASIANSLHLSLKPQPKKLNNT